MTDADGMQIGYLAEFTSYRIGYSSLLVSKNSVSSSLTNIFLNFLELLITMLK